MLLQHRVLRNIFRQLINDLSFKLMDNIGFDHWDSILIEVQTRAAMIDGDREALERLIPLVDEVQDPFAHIQSLLNIVRTMLLFDISLKRSAKSFKLLASSIERYTEEVETPVLACHLQKFMQCWHAIPQHYIKYRCVPCRRPTIWRIYRWCRTVMYWTRKYLPKAISIIS